MIIGSSDRERAQRNSNSKKDERGRATQQYRVVPCIAQNIFRENMMTDNSVFSGHESANESTSNAKMDRKQEKHKKRRTHSVRRAVGQNSRNK